MRKILGSETPHIGIFAESGVILLLSKLLMNTNDNIRIEAAWYVVICIVIIIFM